MVTCEVRDLVLAAEAQQQHCIVVVCGCCGRIHDLEMAVERMKQQQETLQRKLKEEAEQKAKLEVSAVLAGRSLLPERRLSSSLQVLRCLPSESTKLAGRSFSLGRCLSSFPEVLRFSSSKSTKLASCWLLLECRLSASPETLQILIE